MDRLFNFCDGVYWSWFFGVWLRGRLLFEDIRYVCANRVVHPVHCNVYSSKGNNVLRICWRGLLTGVHKLFPILRDMQHVGLERYKEREHFALWHFIILVSSLKYSGTFFSHFFNFTLDARSQFEKRTCIFSPIQNLIAVTQLPRLPSHYA